MPSVYAQKVRDDGSEIEQDLKLRIMPLSATVRFLPIGRGGVEPYVGAGIGAFNWHYSEVGEFIDSRTTFTDNDRFVGRRHGGRSGRAWRHPLPGERRVDGRRGDCAGRRPRARGCSTEEFFLGDKIDLGGWNDNFTVHLRF